MGKEKIYLVWLLSKDYPIIQLQNEIDICDTTIMQEIDQRPVQPWRELIDYRDG